MTPGYQSGMSRLRELREKAGLSQQALGAAVGSSGPQIHRLENNARELTKSWAERLAKPLGTTAIDILFGVSDDVPLVGFVGAGAEAHFYDHDSVIDFVERPPGAPQSIVAAEVRGNSMPGIAEANWLIYFDKSKIAPTDDLINRLCVIGLEEGQIVVKKLGRGSEPGRFTLYSSGEPPMENKTVLWASPVEWIKPR